MLRFKRVSADGRFVKDMNGKAMGAYVYATKEAQQGLKYKAT